MTSIFSILKETAFLWIRNFWYLVALTLVIGIPLQFSLLLASQDGHNSSLGFPVFLALTGFFISFILAAVHAAAVLGLMSGPYLGKTNWQAMKESVKASTWTLVRLNLLLGLFGGVVLMGILGILCILDGGHVGLVFGLGFYLVFIKFALADPLVVVEKFQALAALSRSWEMTKGHFGQVGGCYLFLGMGDYLLHQATGPFTHPANAPMDWVSFVLPLSRRLFESLWLILSWCLYLKIKKTEGEPLLLHPAFQACPSQF